MSSDGTSRQLSIVSPVGYSCSSCGYCTAPGSGKRSGTKSSKSYGIWAHRLSPNHYQLLIDQAWRRSGDYIYKPDNLRTCCPQLPIRLPLLQFKLGKNNKRALTNLLFHTRGSCKKPAKWKGKWSTQRQTDLEARWDEILASTASSDDGPRSSSANNAEKQHASSPSWADTIAGPVTSQLQVTLSLSSSTDEKYQLFRKYQAKIHGEAEDKISTRDGFNRFLVDSSLALTLPSTGLPLSKSERESWKARRMDPRSLPDEIPFGCYHQEYRLDGRLIAVGVLDILPRCISSVYVFYDPDPQFKELQLGKISALQEILLGLRLSRLPHMQDIQHYYMGFYIHSCQKMRYKAEYRPSQLLDCWDNSWHPVDHDSDGDGKEGVRTFLDRGRCFGWSSQPDSMGTDSASTSTSDRQPIATSTPTATSQNKTPSSSAPNDDEESECESGSDSEDEGRRIPTTPQPPPGMLDGRAMLQTVRNLVSGHPPQDDGDSREAELKHMEILKLALVLESKHQAHGFKPLLMSNLAKAFVEEEQDSDFVQAVECISALRDPELVGEMILFL
ncbi:hypothetical protein BCV70DRAFT_198140 [Testicularia cyperi]|uniref:arginyltransferase n=1 Tax=Testicularia cyperi TaxID=1882483 RepID=A0A317XUX8_9BASI|nr:hypothetical protein BCV70DRAFT_198140 [Testicularia cyperi]